MTFQDLSKPYLDLYGEPQKVFHNKSKHDSYIQWCWPNHDIMVEFTCPGDNKPDGWELAKAYWTNTWALEKECGTTTYQV
jgi:hypothetical protein